MSEENFPEGTALVEALIDLHRDLDEDNEEVLDLIETEMGTDMYGLVELKYPDEKPVPDAPVDELVEVHETFAGQDKGVGRYIRLRIFERFDAFEDVECGQKAGLDVQSRLNVPSELSDEDLAYLSEIDDTILQSIIEDEAVERGLKKPQE
jgi:hypothetical protein